MRMTSWSILDWPCQTGLVSVPFSVACFYTKGNTCVVCLETGRQPRHWGDMAVHESLSPFGAIRARDTAASTATRSIDGVVPAILFGTASRIGFRPHAPRVSLPILAAAPLRDLILASWLRVRDYPEHLVRSRGDDNVASRNLAAGTGQYRVCSASTWNSTCTTLLEITANLAARWHIPQAYYATFWPQPVDGVPPSCPWEQATETSNGNLGGLTTGVAWARPTGCGRSLEEGSWKPPHAMPQEPH